MELNQASHNQYMPEERVRLTAGLHTAMYKAVCSPEGKVSRKKRWLRNVELIADGSWLGKPALLMFSE